MQAVLGAQSNRKNDDSSMKVKLHLLDDRVAADINLSLAQETKTTNDFGGIKVNPILHENREDMAKV